MSYLEEELGRLEAGWQVIRAIITFLNQVNNNLYYIGIYSFRKGTEEHTTAAGLSGQARQT